MRRRCINRRPKSLFRRLSVCTIIRGKELRELSTAQLSQPVFFSNWIRTIMLGKCIWRTSLAVHGMLRQWEMGRSRKDGRARLIHVRKDQQLLVCTSLWYLRLFPGIRMSHALLSFLLVYREAAGGGRQGGVTGRARAGVSQIWLRPYLLTGPQFPYL